MLDTPCSEVVWRVLATHCIRQFPLHSPPPRPLPCAITFQLDSTDLRLAASQNSEDVHSAAKEGRNLAELLTLIFVKMGEYKYVRCFQIQICPPCLLNCGPFFFFERSYSQSQIWGFQSGVAEHSSLLGCTGGMDPRVRIAAIPVRLFNLLAPDFFFKF